MTTSREQYRKYSLIVLIIVLGALLFFRFLPFLSGILGACTVYVLVRKQMHSLTEKKNIHKSIAAIIILVEVILCFLIPAFVAIWLVINQILSIDLNPTLLMNNVQHFIDLIQNKTGYNLFSSDNVATFVSFVTKMGQVVVEQISEFVINAVILLFILYFMLVSSRQLERYVYSILPFTNKNKARVLAEINVMVKSNAIGIPLLGIIQGVFALIGYYIFGVPNPILFGFLTCIATIIPLVGTALVWAPLAGYLALNGNWTGGLGLALFALVIISNIDNLVRFVLQKKMADTHPLITVFGVVVGLPLFGFWGVIFGPLLISAFILFFNIFKEEYLDEEEGDTDNSGIEKA